MWGRDSWLSKACRQVILPFCPLPLYLPPSACNTHVMFGGTGATLWHEDQRHTDGWRNRSLDCGPPCPHWAHCSGHRLLSSRLPKLENKQPWNVAMYLPKWYITETELSTEKTGDKIILIGYQWLCLEKSGGSTRGKKKKNYNQSNQWIG